MYREIGIAEDGTDVVSSMLVVLEDVTDVVSPEVVSVVGGCIGRVPV